MGILNMIGHKKPKAIAFVDFEHWYISLDKRFNTRPDVNQWYNEISKKYDVRDVYFFADFSNPALRSEIPRIRQITSSIIETQNASNHITKDFTDFIILDHIYQQAISREGISAYIIFSGDGHFSSVTAFLKNRCHKTVEVYGVTGAISSQLRSTASRCTELPYSEKVIRENQQYIDMVLEHLKFLEENNRGNSVHFTSFKDTVKAVSEYNSADKSDISEALQFLITNGYITESDEQNEGSSEVILALHTNWELIEREHVFTEQQKEEKNQSANQSPAQTNSAKVKDNADVKLQNKEEAKKQQHQVKNQQARTETNRNAKQSGKSDKSKQTKQPEKSGMSQQTNLQEQVKKSNIKKDKQDNSEQKNKKHPAKSGVAETAKASSIQKKDSISNSNEPVTNSQSEIKSDNAVNTEQEQAKKKSSKKRRYYSHKKANNS